MVVDIEAHEPVAQDPALQLLHRKPGVDEQRAFAVRVHPVDGQETGHRAHHRADRRQAVLGVHADVEEVLHEPRDLLLQRRDALDVRVHGRDASLQGLDLRGDRDRVRGQPGDAHLHADVPLAGFAFDGVDELLDLPDRRLREAPDAGTLEHASDRIRVDGCLSVGHGASPGGGRRQGDPNPESRILLD
ncbi:MAG: hypothetical protein MZV64_42860 [Ignavibacteriales bacterium]|nr:hypothetical protein [Ignavibacteriales bacterium]